MIRLPSDCSLSDDAEEWSILPSDYPEVPAVETEPRAALSVTEADFWPGSSKDFPPREWITTNVEVGLQIIVSVLGKNI
jgi:hypothetical protein